MNTQVKILNVKDIVPDENQPRKYFAADKMASIAKSIREHGIMTPLVVEKIGQKYLIIDGERRYRAATDPQYKINLHEIPVIIEETQNLVSRLVRQFNIQEQHESWTPLEKAKAMITLSNEMGMNLEKVCEYVGINRMDKSRYVAFAQLADMNQYIKNEIPIDYAPSILSIRRLAARLTQEILEKEWNRSDDKKLEHRIIAEMKNGNIDRKSGFIQLRDVFVQDPKMIENFMNKGGDPQKMFVNSKAQTARALRNIQYGAMMVYAHGRVFLKTKNIPLSSEIISEFKRTRSTIDEMLDLVAE